MGKRWDPMGLQRGRIVARVVGLVAVGDGDRGTTRGVADALHDVFCSAGPRPGAEPTTGPGDQAQHAMTDRKVPTSNAR